VNPNDQTSPEDEDRGSRQRRLLNWCSQWLDNWNGSLPVDLEAVAVKATTEIGFVVPAKAVRIAMERNLSMRALFRSILQEAAPDGDCRAS
jgi:RNase P protein component